MSSLAERLLRERVPLALDRARTRRHPVLLSLSLPILPPEDPLALLENAPPSASHAFFWQRPADQQLLAGVGATAVCTGHGANRFATVAEACERILVDAVDDGLDTTTALGPRFVGGFAFADELDRGPMWRGFPAGQMILSRVQVVQAGAVARSTYNVMIDGGDTVDEVVHGLRDDIAWMESAAVRRTAKADEKVAPACRVIAPRSIAPWRDAVAATVADIRAGRFEKLVLARSCSVRSSRPIDCARLVRQLRQTYPTCTTFWVRSPSGSFLGATPELLAGLDNGTIRSAAVAGSIARGVAPAADRELARCMLRSSKERHEHAVVVRAIESALAPVCSALDVPPDPQVLALDNVQHLLTPIKGRACGAQHILDLVRRLHPSPAVAGHPRQAALDALCRRERLHRGWYAGPIGWMDARQNGEFVVAIRSALVRGQQATLFAGAGIMAESDPDTELAETHLKMQPLLSLLTGM